MSKKILVVEDEPTLAKALKLKLENEGFDILTAKNGLEGLQMTIKEKPDLILLDIVMPTMNGMEMLERLRKSEVADTQVIILTNLDDEGSMAEAMEYHTYDYLVKSNWPIEKIADKIKEKIG